MPSYVASFGASTAVEGLSVASGRSSDSASLVDVYHQPSRRGELHRYLGVGIGEHIGYLATDGWTLLVAASAVAGGVLPAWLAVVGDVIGLALLAGTLEFVRPNEPEGWPLAGTIVSIAYITWSIWHITIGVVLLIG